MKKVLIICTMILFQNLAEAQRSRRPYLDITVNPMSWADRQANLSVQIMALPRMGLWISGDFAAAEGPWGSFQGQSVQQGFQIALRIFPFGTPGRHKLKDIFKRETGCPNQFRGQQSQKTHPFFSGIYIAPGYFFQQQNLMLTPAEHVDSPIENFDYKIINQGGMISTGYQLRLGHLTIGAGWGIQISQPTWDGPADIFGDNLYTTTFPSKLNIQQNLMLEAGINF